MSGGRCGTTGGGRARLNALVAAGCWAVAARAPAAEAPPPEPAAPASAGAPSAADPAPDEVPDASLGEIDTVTVAVTRRPRNEVNRTSLEASELATAPGAAGDPIAVVQNLAGVARSSFASGELIVRGAAPEDSRVFVEGLEIPLIYHFGGLRSVIPVTLLAGIDFYPGNFAPRYGRATGGVVDVRLAPLEPEREMGIVDVSLLDASLYLATPLGPNAALAVAGRRSYIGEVLAAALPSDALSFRVAPHYYDYQLLASYQPSPGHTLRLFALGSADAVELVLDNPADLDPNLEGDDLTSSESFQRVVLGYHYAPNESFDNRLSLAYGHSREDDALGQQLAIDITTHRFDLRDTARHELVPGVALSYGLDVALVLFDAFVSAPRLPKEGEPEEFDLSELVRARETSQRVSPASFAELELAPCDALQLFPGVRADHFGGVRAWSIQPRLNARLALSESLLAKAGFGWFSQAPSDDELNPDVGNPALGVETAIHASLGAEWHPWPLATIDGTLFYRSLRDLVSRSDTVRADSNGAPQPVRFDNGGRGRAYGAELLLRHELAGGFSGWLAYTLSRSTREDSGETETRFFDHDQTHILTLLGSYQLGRGWQLGARFRLVSGNPRTPVVGAVFDADADRYEPRYGRPLSARNAAFHQLDLRVDKRWRFAAWQLGAYLELQNAYNRQNAEGLAYNYDYRRSTRQSGLPLLPVFGVRADF